MPHFRQRDIFLILLGALSMHIFALVCFPFGSDQTSIEFDTQPIRFEDSRFPPPVQPNVNIFDKPQKPQVSKPVSVELVKDLPETKIVSHAPGWTVFQNLYMAEGTLFLVSTYPRKYFPDIRLMTSTGLPGLRDEENIRLREPTRNEMDFLSPEEAKRRWGGDVLAGERNRVREVEGNTFLINDPPQFLRHYYHFVAELLLGAWAFWTGTFSPSPFPAPSPPESYISQGSNIPPFHRFIFAHSNADGWRDDPGFNSYFLRAAFPSLAVEHIEDWEDRIDSTTPPSSPYNFSHPDPDPAKTFLEIRKSERAWLFPMVLLADRSAAFRGESCPSRTQRTASEAVEAMQDTDRLPKGWWEPVRKAVVRYAGASDSPSQPSDQTNSITQELPEKVVITYVSRQGTRRRKLITEDHDQLVLALEELVQRKNGDGLNWELNVVQAENMNKDAQVRLVGRTDILLGVHGNGLSHLVLVAPTRIATVIEIFFPGGFAHDYEWTTRALGMKHFAVWNDTYRTHPNEPKVDYPEGFQDNSIPVYGPAVAKLIEQRVDGLL